MNYQTLSDSLSTVIQSCERLGNNQSIQADAKITGLDFSAVQSVLTSVRSYINTNRAQVESVLTGRSTATSGT
jgi:hypothetical protein